MVRIDRWRDPREKAEFPGPLQSLPAIGADMTRPFPVVDLPQRGEDRGASVPIHGEDAPEIFREEDPGVSDLSEKSSLRVARFAFRDAGEERAFRERRRRIDVVESRDRVQKFRLPASGRADEREPDGISGEPMRDDGRDDREEGIRLGKIEPVAQRRDRVREPLVHASTSSSCATRISIVPRRVSITASRSSIGRECAP